MPCAKPIDFSFGLWTRVGRRKHKFNRIRRWHQCALMVHADAQWGMHIGATWRIRLMCPFAAAIRPYVKLLWSLVVVTTHRSITYVDAAYCYRPSNVVCQSVCHTGEPCKNGRTDRGAVWVEDSGGPKEPRIRWGFGYPVERGNFKGDRGGLL